MSAVGVGLSLAANAAIVGGIAAMPIIKGYMEGDEQKRIADQQGRETDRARRDFEANQAQSQGILDPYQQTGEDALQQQAAISGALGPEAQQAAIQQIENSSQFKELALQGEDAILQNASATGGLRGGNTQAALAQFRPQLLSQLIDQQYSRLGGLSGGGLNAASQQAGMGMQGAGMSADLRGQAAAARAGGGLARLQSISGGWNQGANNVMGLYGGAAQMAMGAPPSAWGGIGGGQQQQAPNPYTGGYSGNDNPQGYY